MPVRETTAMIRGMAPRLLAGEVGFACLPAMTEVPPEARAALREDEGLTLVLPLGHPHLPAEALPMRQITLSVVSALDGVGLTAAVATALAEAQIPCNVIAGFHHDHIFVPSPMGDRAVEVLAACARGG